MQKNIAVFDYNIVIWYYFLLKFTAIKHLSYEEFYQNGFDVTKNTWNY